MNLDTNYILSGSSSIGDSSTIYTKTYNKNFKVLNPKYKKSTLKQNFGKKKRKHQFNSKRNNVQSMELESIEANSMDAQSITMRSSEKLSSFLQ